MSQPLIIRILSASVAVANRAGELIREVLRRGNLGLVQKVYLYALLKGHNMYG